MTLYRPIAQGSERPCKKTVPLPRFAAETHSTPSGNTAHGAFSQSFIRYSRKPSVDGASLTPEKTTVLSWRKGFSIRPLCSAW